jgi:hypothetical protein
MALVWRTDNRDAVRREVHERAAKALWQAAEYLLDESNRTIPVEEGTMERSGEAVIDEEALIAAVSYGGAASAYVLRQHEETTWSHSGNGRAKWLEYTFKEQASRIAAWLAERMRW